MSFCKFSTSGDNNQRKLNQIILDNTPHWPPFDQHTCHLTLSFLFLSRNILSVKNTTSHDSLLQCTILWGRSEWRTVWHNPGHDLNFHPKRGQKHGSLPLFPLLSCVLKKCLTMVDWTTTKWIGNCIIGFGSLQNRWQVRLCISSITLFLSFFISWR